MLALAALGYYSVYHIAIEEGLGGRALLEVAMAQDRARRDLLAMGGGGGTDYRDVDATVAIMSDSTLRILESQLRLSPPRLTPSTALSASTTTLCSNG